MKNLIRLSRVLLACCLCLTLLPAVAETVSPDADPALIGCWLLKIEGDWGQYNYKADGTWESFRYSNVNNNIATYGSGTYIAKDGILTIYYAPGESFGDGDTPYVIEGDTYHVTIDGTIYEAHRMTRPLARVLLPETVTAASTDPALTGVWKGEDKGVYSEWTFMRDGTYEKITPADDKIESGVYIASGGVLVIILDNEVLQGLYNPHNGVYMELVFGSDSIFPKKEYSGGRLAPVGGPD